MRHFLKIVVLDEVEEMFSRGLQQKVKDSFKYFPYDIQLAVFSSTIPKEFLKLHGHLLRNPAKILLNQERKFDGIKQYFICVDKKELKMSVILDLYCNLDINQAVIFCNTDQAANELGKEMKEHDFGL